MTKRPTGLAAPGALAVSIMAANTIANLLELCPGIEASVRSMPNLLRSVARDASVAYADPTCDAGQFAFARRMLGRRDTDDITIFKAVGTALSDITAGALAHRATVALAQGI